MRTYVLKALVEFVKAMGFDDKDLIATIAIFHRATESASQPNAELRIGISTRDKPSQIISGVALPCTKEEAEMNQDTVAGVLQTCKVGKLYELTQLFTMEWCEDCGAPLYANPEGLVVHIEPPEDIQEDTFAPTLN